MSVFKDFKDPKDLRDPKDPKDPKKPKGIYLSAFCSPFSVPALTSSNNSSMSLRSHW